MILQFYGYVLQLFVMERSLVKRNRSKICNELFFPGKNQTIFVKPKQLMQAIVFLISKF